VSFQTARVGALPCLCKQGGKGDEKAKTNIQKDLPPGPIST